jgi:hypothetical protein
MSGPETTLPDKDAWKRAAETGERVVRASLGDKVMRRMKRGADPWDALALGFGAHKAVVEYLVAMSQPDGRSVMEANLLATVRGICRGCQWPINEDGTRYEGTPL